jgi:hypothetical protein
MDPLVAIECSSEAVRVENYFEDVSSKTDLGVIKTVSRHFLVPIEIVYIYSRSDRPRAIKWDHWAMMVSENILSTTYFVSDGCQSTFANFQKIWSTWFQLPLSTFMNGTKVVWTLRKQNGFSFHPTKEINYWMKALTNNFFFELDRVKSETLLAVINL